MAVFDLRLYKRTSSPKSLYRMVDAYQIEAKDASEAKSIAREVEIPAFDDSDYAVLYGPDGAELWRVDH